MPGLTDTVDVAAGGHSSYALAGDGSLWVWGDNAYGQLGLGDTTDRATPTQLFAPAGYRFTSIDSDAYGTHAAATIARVPEPASTLALGCVALICRRRRC